MLSVTEKVNWACAAVWEGITPGRRKGDIKGREGAGLVHLRAEKSPVPVGLRAEVRQEVVERMPGELGEGSCDC